MEVFAFPVVDWLVLLTHLYEHFFRGTDEFEGRFDFCLGVLGLNRGRNDADVEVLGANSVGVRNHGDIDI